MTNVPLNLQLGSDLTIQSVQEQEWESVALDFMLRDVSQEAFAATRTALDARFVNLATGLLRMSFHSLVLRTPHCNVLIDTCVGNHKERPLIQPWHQQTFPYLQRLTQLQLAPTDIDYVCCTHFHADHVGWNTRLENGTWVPTFPNARYLFAEPEVRYWEQVHKDNPEHIFTQSWNDSVLPVIEAKQADIVSPEHEIVTGVQLRPAFGHSPGNVVIDVSSGQDKAVLSGDVLHHPVQIERPDWNSVFDQDPAMAQATRAALVADVADGHTHLIGAHFAGPAALRVTEQGGRFSYR
ncbi:MAG: MBL fold metallo-hydrolase [Gammaproteobacteria bacterium]|jgi:glyoxylase-like metal-dependent hydrolase (beta-lactamase superfamily II)